MTHALPRLLCLLLTVGTACSAGAADWPQWRHDAGRGSAAPEAIPDGLSLRWQREYGAREPVWDDPLNWDLMRYDRVLEPVVAGKRLFLGFNDSDKVVALDTETGRELWRFYTDGPVRFPPAVWEDGVYAVSDDGYLYCLDAATGALRWRFRGGPSDRKILGNKRLISTWPARGGVVVLDGTVYFGASIWPMMGTFLYALDAATGEVTWVNDGTSAQYIKQPHDSPSFAGVAPQGALVATGRKLLVPGGRSVPACFDRLTGDFLYFHLADGKRTGGSFVCAAGDGFFNHYREGLTTLYQLADGEELAAQMGRFPVITPETWYFPGDSIRAFDAAAVLADPEQWEDQLQWEVKVDAAGDLILAGDTLYAGGATGITALRLQPDDVPVATWHRQVPGTVERLVAADGKLFAVTLEGGIFAFGVKDGADTASHVHFPVLAAPEAQPDAADLASILQLGVSEGYALFHGAGDGALLEGLARETELRIVATDPDPERVAALRRHFDGLGWYGKRVTVHVGTPETFPAPPYLASLTVVNDGAQAPDAARLAAVFPSMRPYGGAAWVRTVNGESPGDLSAALKAAGVTGYDMLETEGPWRFARKGPLEGAGTWTHTYGDIANTVKSDDRLVKLPLGILWFGGSSNLDVLPRHGHGPPEQVVGGRLFIQGHDVMSARDVYTGRVIWKTPLPGLDTFGVYYDDTYADTPTSTAYNQVHIPGANIRGTNFVATVDRVYVVVGGACAVLDATTGARLGTFYLPRFADEATGQPLPPEWGYIGTCDSLLLGGNQFVPFSTMEGAKSLKATAWNDFDMSASREMAALDRYSGEVRWRARAEHGFLHNGTAVGNGVIYLIDRLPLSIEQRLSRRGTMPPEDYRLLALDVYSGRPLWEKRRNVFGSFLAYSEEHDILLQSTRPSRDMTEGEDGVRMIAYDGKTGAILWDRPNTYETLPILHGERIVTEGAMFGLLTGEPLSRTNPLTGEQEPWTFKRNYGCNYPIASEYLITFRSAAAGFFDLATDGGTGSLGGFKSGCTSNLVVADGVLNAPDYTRTCSCSYQNQTSLAMVHMPDAALWTFNVFNDEDIDGPVRRLGINFGAPGDRMAEDGTLWLEYPVVGGPSPDIPLVVYDSEGAEPGTFRHHPTQFAGEGPDWIAASGLTGVEDLRLTLAKDGLRRFYTVRLHFAAPDPGAAPRPVDVSLQGETVLSAFDVAAEAGGPRRGVVREFRAVPVEDTLNIRLAPPAGTGPVETVLCGIEITAENVR